MQNNYKLQKQESLLCELLPSALAELGDNRLNSLSVVDVKLARGRYFARVFLNASFIEERGEILRALKKAAPLLRQFIAQQSGWFRVPELAFEFSDEKEQNRLDEIFSQIQKERSKSQKTPKDSIENEVKNKNDSQD